MASRLPEKGRGGLKALTRAQGLIILGAAQWGLVGRCLLPQGSEHVAARRFS